MEGAERISLPGRVAAPDEGIGADELALAARNHGMPLEALRYDVTPVGLHYLLTHYDIPFGAAEEWRLEVDGARGPVRFDLETLRGFPAETVRVTMECAGNGRARLLPRPVSQPWLVEAVGTADWTGVPLRLVLDAAGLDDTAAELVFSGADHGLERGVEQDYERSLPFAEATRPEVLLAYAMNGVPLPPQHGGPLRLVVPGWYGMAHVKWLRRIRAIAGPFDGFQQTTAYRLRQEADEEGVPVTRIQPRALLEPPGFPDFMSRTRIVRPGPMTLRGRAWSGRSAVVGVEVSTDDGVVWHPAALTPADPAHPWAWRSWTFPWTAAPGDHVIAVRASDFDGPQPSAPPWNLGGFANNAPHRVPVVCAPPG
ncbi:sulfite oxidase [Actinocorallia aurea]